MSAILYLNDFTYDGLSNFNVTPKATYSFGAKVIIHPRGSFPDMTQAMIIPPGTEGTFRVDYTEYTRLGAPYFECKHNEINPSIYDGFSYTEQLCNSACLQEYVFSKCKCVHMETISLPSQRSRASFCGRIENWNINNTVKRLACAQSAIIEYDNSGTHGCHCTKPCKYKKYKANVLSSPWPHEAYYLSFYYYYLRNSPIGARFTLLEHYLDLVLNHSMSEEVHRWLRNYSDISRNFIQIKVELQPNMTNIITMVPKSADLA